jgi:hypothetical protein
MQGLILVKERAMGKKTERIEKWSSELTAEQMRPLLVELVEFAMEAEMVSVGDLAPYWETTGDPLIDGQQTFADD